MSIQQDEHNKLGSITLRDYQQLALSHLLLRIAQGCLRMYITLPTGTGKAVILSAVAARRMAVGRVLILIHRQDIATQLVQVLKQAGLNTGLLMQRHHALAAPVLVAMTQSLTQGTLQELLHSSERPIATILIDEAHHAVTGSAYERILLAVEEASHPLRLPVIGFTATPYRSDEASMLSLLPTCAFARDIPDMIRAKRLAPLTWESVQVNLDLAGLVTASQSGETDFAEEALSSQMVRDEVTSVIVQEVTARIGSRPTLLFAASVKHAQQFAQLFCERGVPARAVSGAMSRAEREQVYADWRSGAIQMVCNCSLLTEGFDFPEIAALVMARPTLSPNLYIQMLGRGTRLAPGKEDCLVLDIVGNQPEASRQVTLPQILGEREARSGSPRTHTPATEPKQVDALVTTMLKAVLGKDGETSGSLLDPIGQSQYSWVAYRHGPHEGYFASVSQWEVAIIERDPTGSGLYRSRLYLMPPDKPEETRWVEPDYLPLRQQVALIHQETDARYNYRLGSRNAAWRERPATPKQREALCRMYRERAGQMTETLMQGEASDMIMNFKLRKTLLHPPEPEKPATGY